MEPNADKAVRQDHLEMDQRPTKQIQPAPQKVAIEKYMDLMGNL